MIIYLGINISLTTQAPFTLQQRSSRDCEYPELMLLLFKTFVWSSSLLAFNKFRIMRWKNLLKEFITSEEGNKSPKLGTFSRSMPLQWICLGNIVKHSDRCFLIILWIDGRIQKMLESELSVSFFIISPIHKLVVLYFHCCQHWLRSSINYIAWAWGWSWFSISMFYSTGNWWLWELDEDTGVWL